MKRLKKENYQKRELSKDEKRKRYQRLKQSIVPGFGLAVKVLGPRKEDVEFAMRLLKKNIKNVKLMNEYYERQEFIKPSAKKREMKSRAKMKQRLQTLAENE